MEAFDSELVFLACYLVHHLKVSNLSVFLHFRFYLSQSSQTEVPPEYLVALSVHLQNILRNKRCLLAYMQVRRRKGCEKSWFICVVCTCYFVSCESGLKARYDNTSYHHSSSFVAEQAQRGFCRGQ